MTFQRDYKAQKQYHKYTRIESLPLSRSERVYVYTNYRWWPLCIVTVPICLSWQAPSASPRWRRSAHLSRLTPGFRKRYSIDQIRILDPEYNNIGSGSWIPSTIILNSDLDPDSTIFLETFKWFLVNHIHITYTTIYKIIHIILNVQLFLRNRKKLFFMIKKIQKCFRNFSFEKENTIPIEHK